MKYTYIAYLFEGDMKLAPCLLALLISGCAASDLRPAGTFAQGRLISVSEAKVIMLQIDGSGRMSGVDTSTIEAFHGTYQLADGAAAGRMTGILTGNKGTVFNIEMTMKTGKHPIGGGEATDNSGKKYNIQF